jgi:hypothetical protein
MPCPHLQGLWRRGLSLILISSHRVKLKRLSAGSKISPLTVRLCRTTFRFRRSVGEELIDTSNDLYPSEGGATLVGVSGENDEFQVQAFVRPSDDMETEVRGNGK